ncbi:MAG: HAD family hydrolase [bacterium]
MKLENTGQSERWIFMDAGDTFIYGYPTFYEAIRDCMSTAGQECSLDTIKKAVHVFMEAAPPENITTQDKFRTYFHSMYRNVLEQLSYSEEINRGVSYLWGEWESGHRLRLFDDSYMALKILKEKGFKLAILSNWDTSFQKTLARLGVEHFFDIILASCEIGIAKPDPEFFHHALQLAKTKAEQVTFLGDQIDYDLVPAKNLGMKTVYVDYYGREKKSDAVDYYVPSMSVAAWIL